MTAQPSSRVYWSAEVAAAAADRYRRLLDAWCTPHNEHRIATSQGETFAISAGPPRQPAVVLLPGGMATSAMWLRTITALAEGFHVIAVDLIGDAGFSAPSRPRMKSDAHARWLDEVLDALGVDGASFVGASLGGWFALDYAIRRTARVRGLMLLAPAGVGRIRPGFLLRVAPLLLLGAWGHRRALDFDMAFSAAEPAPGEAAFIELFNTVKAGFRARMQPIPVFSNRQLRRLDMPLMAVVGGRDVVFDSAATQGRLQSHAADARVLMLPQAGHGLADMTMTIRDFLLQADAATSVR